mgnify:CR=1 FL=1
MSEQTLFVIAIFAVALLLSLAIMVPFTGSAARTRRRLRERIRALSGEAVATERISLVRHSYLQRLSPLERRLEAMPALAPVVRLLEQAGIGMPAYRLVLFGLGAALGALLFAPILLGSAAALAAAALAGAAPFLWLLHKKQQRRLQFEQGLPDALSMLSRTLRAGMPLSQALQIVSKELTGPVAVEFGTVFTELNYGGDLRQALAGMLERVPSVSVMALSAAIMIQRETGGNLADVVARLERLIRERFRFERNLRTLTAANKVSAWIVIAMPFALAGMMELMSPGYMSALTDNAGGRQLLWGALGMQVIGIIWIQKMIRLDV